MASRCLPPCSRRGAVAVPPDAASKPRDAPLEAAAWPAARHSAHADRGIEMTVRCPQPQLRDLDSPLSEAAPPLATEWSDVGGLVMSRFARTDRAYIPIAF